MIPHVRQRAYRVCHGAKYLNFFFQYLSSPPEAHIMAPPMLPQSKSLMVLAGDVQTRNSLTGSNQFSSVVKVEAMCRVSEPIPCIYASVDVKYYIYPSEACVVQSCKPCRGISCPRKAKASWQRGALDSMSFPLPQVNPCQRAVSASVHNSKTTVAESRNLKITTIPATAHVVREEQPQTPPRFSPSTIPQVKSRETIAGSGGRADCRPART